MQVKFRQRRPAGVQTSSSSASAAARAGAVQILPSIDGPTSGSAPVMPGKPEQAAEDTPRNGSPSVSSQALHRLRQMVRGPNSSSGAGERGGSACTAALGVAAAAVLRMHAGWTCRVTVCPGGHPSPCSKCDSRGGIPVHAGDADLAGWLQSAPLFT